MRKTNDVITEIVKLIEEAIGYKEADMQHSLESDAKEQAANDKERTNNLSKALYLVKISFKQ